MHLSPSIPSRPWIRASILSSILASALVSTLAFAAPPPPAPASATTSTAPAAQDFDHSLLDAALKAHVSPEGVDYGGIATSAELKAYVAALATADPGALPGRKARLAFWINAYNALTLSGVARHWPDIRSVSEVYPDFGFFKRKDYTVGGKALSLNAIEHEIIRPGFKDPRVHAALNCASVSCPPLLNRAFAAARLDAQLDAVCAAWVNDDRRNQLRADGLKVSQIFEWFAEDFKAAGGVKAWIGRYAKGEKQAAVQAAETLSYLPYDWRLNRR